MPKFLLCCFLSIQSLACFALTWDEPWHEEVVANSDLFGLFSVISSSDSHATFQPEVIFSGENPEGNLEVRCCSLLEISSWTGDLDEHLHEVFATTFQGFVEGQRFFLFLSRDDAGRWLLPSPTAGFDLLQDDGKVGATYRTSIHKALVSEAIYIKTQTCIFEKLNGSGCGDPEVAQFVTDQLSLPVYELGPNSDEAQMNGFFNQHAALETAGLANLPVTLELLEPFIEADFFHVQASAIRLHAKSSINDIDQSLATFICRPDVTDFGKGFAIMELGANLSATATETLEACLESLSEEPVGLGMNIMDPRVGTSFPYTIKGAISHILEREDGIQ